MSREDGTWASVRALPPLTTATATLYGCGAVLLAAGAVTWVPGKNPRWVITTLAIVAAVFFVWVMIRGRLFSRAEALFMIAAELFTVGCLTWTTHLSLGAFANGTVLPIAGVYIIWFLHPVAGRLVLYAGTGWWFVAILHQDDTSLVAFGSSLIVQTIIAAEAFARIKARMDRQVRTDLLTGTLNRRGINEILDRELSRATRRGGPLSVVAVDLDGLRNVNNTQGHTAGDRLLEQTTNHWNTKLRRHDAIGRIGGDEFLFVLPGTTLEQAGEIVRRLADDSPGSWSAGVAMAKPGDSAQSVLDRADRRMYQDKAARHGTDVPTAHRGPTVQS